MPPLDPVKHALQTQLVAEVLPSSEFEFAVHDSHAVAATESEYLPSGHMSQSASPVAGLYVPATQGLQFKTPPVKPLLQVHHPNCLLPSGELELLGQLTHSAEPYIALYVPASHLEHGPPLGPVEPE